MLIESLLTAFMRRSVRLQMEMSRAEAGFRPQPAAGKSYLLYLHIPFCETLCPYCSFNRIRFQADDAAVYFRALRREMETYKDLGFAFDGVYVGGGTPTVLPDELASILRLARNLWPIRSVSVETHPCHLTPETIAILKQAGINRLSVGVQTFNEELLRRLSRLEAHGTTRQARERLLQVKDQFDTVNVDMIYNFPGQSLDMLRDDLRIVRELGMGQVTFYPLMEGRLEFREKFGRVDLRQEARLHAAIEAELADDYRPVSAWCYGRGKGLTDEYIASRDEYAGLGAGSFGYIDGVLYANSFGIPEYVESAEQGKLPIAAVRRYRKSARMRYDLLMQLFGGSLDLSYMQAKYGRGWRLRLWMELLFFRITGAAARRGGAFALTPRGRYYLVIMMREFFSGLNRLRSLLAPQASPS